MKEQIIIYEVVNGAFLPRKINLKRLIKDVNEQSGWVSKFFLRKHDAYEHIDERINKNA